ncbi:MAG: twin-arginine translocase TatA/TatE family subunit [Rikenellaceae bacterium]
MEQLFIGGLGSGELVLIVIVLLLLFGSTKLPDLMRGAGRGIREFKEAMNNPVKDDKAEAKPEEKAAEAAKEEKKPEAK